MAIRTTARLIALGCIAVTVGAAAQIGLPSVRLPSLPTTGLTASNRANRRRRCRSGTGALTSLRRTTAMKLIRQNRQLIEADPNGEPILRGQLLALDLRAAALERIVAAGFVRVSGQRLEGRIAVSMY
jgi:hypothetical protein